MRFGCCVKPDQIAILAAAGYDFCELTARDVLPFEDDRAALPVLSALAAAPLRCEAFNQLVPPTMPLVGPAVDLAALRAYLRRAFERMVQVGGMVVVLGSGDARRIPEGMSPERALDQLAEVLALAADEAQRAGIELALEHLARHYCNVFTSLDESQAFVQARDLTGVRLLADLHHLELENEALADVVAAAPLLAHVHVADGDRRPPGNGGYNYDGFMAALHAAGYNRRISAKCVWRDLPAEAPGALAFMHQRWTAIPTGSTSR